MTRVRADFDEISDPNAEYTMRDLSAEAWVETPEEPGLDLTLDIDTVAENVVEGETPSDEA